MAARHGGGLRVVAEPATGAAGRPSAVANAATGAGGSPDPRRFAVYGDWGRLASEVAVFDAPAGVVRAVDPASGESRGIRAVPFERLFPPTEAERLPDLDALRRLGEALTFREHDDAHDRETDIPAAYTYFGQFVFHDITHWKPPAGDGPSAGLRSAALDLDSVLGFAPSDEPDLTAPLPLGLTTRDLSGCSFAADLPRSPCGAPLVADARNDDNLALAQVHVAMTAFANAVRAEVGPRGGAAALAARHVQAVVLSDYLPRILDPDVYRDVMENGRAIVWPDCTEAGTPFLVPLEFIAACGRFGHAMVKYRYDWNAHHPGAGAPAFWESTYSSTAYPLRMLDWSWVTDWARLLPPEDREPDGRWPLRAAALSSRLADPLRRMPEAALPPGGPGQPPLSANLATRSLERAQSLRLASGQAAVRRVNEQLAALGRPSLPLLSRDDILADESEAAGALLLAEGPGGARLCDETPMWLYVLKEAEAQQGGRRLGAFGSRIVGETLHAAIAAASPSILAGDGGRPALSWRPDPRLRPARPDRYGLRDLVAFAGLLAPLPALAAEV